MSDTTTSGDRFVAAETTEDHDEILAVAVNAPDVVVPTGVSASAIIGRSPGQLAWLRLRRDRSVVFTSAVLVFFAVLAVGAPLWSALYGQDALANHSELLSLHGGLPIGVNGGMSGVHWFGVEPGLGRDIMMQLVYGLRNVAGHLVRGSPADNDPRRTGRNRVRLRAGLARRADQLVHRLRPRLPLPDLLVGGHPGDRQRRLWQLTHAASVVPHLRPDHRAVRVRLAVHGTHRPWTGAVPAGARVRRGGPGRWRGCQPYALPPAAAESLGADPRGLLAQCSVSHHGGGCAVLPPDRRARTDARPGAHDQCPSVPYLASDPWFTLLPGTTILLLVLAFNLLGDSVRDALDPKSSR